MRILLVDDDSDSLDELTYALRNYGADVIALSDPVLALQTIRGDDNITVVVSDLDMTGVDGLALLREIAQDARLSRRRLDCIVMSGHATKSDEDHVRAAGARFFLRKPFGVKELYLILRELQNAGMTIGEERKQTGGGKSSSE